VKLILTHKAVEFEFRDLETEMNTPAHLLRHGDFTLYDTSAIVGYSDEVFPEPSLTPTSVHQRAKMNQWISAVNSYYYPQIVFHLSHERSVFPALGIEPDERVVQAVLPKIERALDVMERELNARPAVPGRQRSHTCRLIHGTVHDLAGADGGGQRHARALRAG
jgi:glutathione S-transferase